MVPDRRAALNLLRHNNKERCLVLQTFALSPLSNSNEISADLYFRLGLTPCTVPVLHLS
jgi:hypothetical protein